MSDTLHNIMEGNIPADMGQALGQISQERGICLGDLTYQEMERRMKVTFPDDLREYFINNHRHKASGTYEHDEWHCFDIPFELHVGSRDRAAWLFQKISDLHPDVDNFNIRFPM